MKNNENRELCSMCNGACCKRMPGIVHPKQLKTIDKKSLFLLYQNGYQFDYYEYDDDDNKKGYYLRPQTTKSIGQLVDPSWGGTCIFFEDHLGCKLSFDQRPLQCQTLIPQKEDNEYKCHTDNSSPVKTKLDYAKAWEPYETLIQEIITENS